MTDTTLSYQGDEIGKYTIRICRGQKVEAEFDFQSIKAALKIYKNLKKIRILPCTNKTVCIIGLHLLQHIIPQRFNVLDRGIQGTWVNIVGSQCNNTHAQSG